MPLAKAKAIPSHVHGGLQDQHLWWNANAGSDVPLVSDMAPLDVSTTGGTSNRITTTPLTGNTYGPYIFNSGNHGGDGQNVGFGDDHVVFETNPYVGQDQDNIFTFWADPAKPPPAGTQTGLKATGAAATVYALGETATPPYDICMIPARNVTTGAW